jgi:hypothetical protein
MHVIVDPHPALKKSALSRSSVSTGFQTRGAGNVTSVQAALRDKTVMTRLIMAALAGLISAFAAIFTTVIYPNDIGWRDLWLAVCVAGFVGLLVFLWKACEQF